MNSEELNRSELGTQEYWDNVYKCEVNNFRDHGDAGEVWFGEESINRICNWILKSTLITKTSKIIDVGCGNGLFLIKLAKNGFENLVGVDYSTDAITLANEIASKENCTITYQVHNILTDNSLDKYNVVHDKGTYDAISLSDDARASREVYIEKVHSMLEDNGLFIITTCNWTEQELELHFKLKFNLLYVIPTPQLKFGGKTGNSVSSLVLRKC